MTVATPPGEGNPDDGRSWPVAVVDMIDRALGSRPRFRRLVVLVMVLVLALALLMLFLHSFGLPMPLLRQSR